MKQYKIYLNKDGTILAQGNSDFTAICNLTYLQKKYGKENISIEWREDK